MPWKGETWKWRKQETSNALGDILESGKAVKDELSYLFAVSQDKKQLWELPWEDIAHDIANGINRRGPVLETSQAIMDMDQLYTYMHMWMQDCAVVRKIVKWQLFQHNGAAKAMGVLCRPGAYLADFIFTLVAIERGLVKATCSYVVIFNHVYVKLATNLGILNDTYKSENNTGNVMECLFWFAYEQKRYDFIITMVHYATEIQLANNINCLLTTSNMAKDSVKKHKGKMDDMAPAKRTHSKVSMDFMLTAASSCKSPQLMGHCQSNRVMNCRKLVGPGRGQQIKYVYCKRSHINKAAKYHEMHTTASSSTRPLAVGVNLDQPAVPLSSTPWNMPLESKTAKWRRNETWNSLHDILEQGKHVKDELCLLF